VKRVITALVTVVVVMCGVAAVGIWLLVRDQPQQLPEISAYSTGHTIRVGPYKYCKVLNLDDCEFAQTVGELHVSDRYPVQVSVPGVISRGLWGLLRLYDNPADNGEDRMRPGTFASTVATVGPHGGRLDKIEVHLFTRARTPTGEEWFVAHAVWSVSMVWR